MTQLPPSSSGSPLGKVAVFKRDRGQNPVPLWRSATIVALAALIWILHIEKPTPFILPQSGVVMHLPGFVNVGAGFVGENAEVTPAEHQILPKDTEFARKNYLDSPMKDQIFCSIVLSGATQQSIHRPEVCLIAQGWSITNQEDVPIRLDSGHLLTVRNLTIQKRTLSANDTPVTVTEYNMYWFVGENVTTPHHFMRVFLSSWDRIVHNRAHRWAYVTVSSRITKNLFPGGLDAAQTKALLIQFIRYIVPHFQKNEMPADAAP